MRLDNGASAVGEVRRCCKFAGEEEILLGLLLSCSARSMNCIFDSISAKGGTDTFGLGHLGLNRVGRSRHCLPLCDCVITDESQASDYIALKEVDIVRGSSFTHGKESSCRLLVETRHFESTDNQAILVY